eukprot:c42166_g1_i1 orf=146-313(+)
MVPIYNWSLWEGHFLSFQPMEAILVLKDEASALLGLTCMDGLCALYYWAIWRILI